MKAVVFETSLNDIIHFTLVWKFVSAVSTEDKAIILDLFGSIVHVCVGSVIHVLISPIIRLLNSSVVHVIRLRGSRRNHG
jgi:hypothetical protein